MKIRCETCMHHCCLEEGQTGRCLARAVRDGRLQAVNYGQVTSLALDPIEKKPLSRFYPGSRILSMGSFGCNLGCPFCQNHEIAMAGGAENHKTAMAEESESHKTAVSVRTWMEQNTVYLSPEALTEQAEKLKAAGNIGVAYTYNEPLTGWEYVRDTARFVREAGMKNVIVTNGSFTDTVLDAVLPLTDAMNIDLKGFTEEYYRKLGGDLETVKHFIRRAYEACHVELTTLIVPGENDSREEMERLSSWIASIDRRIPLHVTRFFPRWKMTDREATDIGVVYELAETAREFLDDVSMGNC